MEKIKKTFFLPLYRATAQLSFMFRRLESSSRRVSVVSDVIGGRRPSTSSILTYSREGGLRFFNPIFNQSMAVSIIHVKLFRKYIVYFRVLLSCLAHE